VAAKALPAEPVATEAPVEPVETSEEVAAEAPVADAGESTSVAGEAEETGETTDETAGENLAAPVTEHVTED
jgi:hypothetical protein